MKISELWLREWVSPKLTREQLSTQMTMSGLEIEEFAPIVEPFENVVVAEVLHVEKHPEADRLHICSVDVGRSEKLSIVCGAKNVKAGMKVPAALDGAVLPNDIKIKHSKIRGVPSQGMLCSAVELGLSEQGEGLLQLPHDAPLGESIWEYLTLNDYVMDVSITPNRGDCLSAFGLAKEISALTQCHLQAPSFSPVKPAIKDALAVSIQVPTECPHYVGRIIRDVKTDVMTPVWLQERLRRSGIRSISPIVDVMNYVMLEVGQPMHAFDLKQISKEIKVRHAKKNETLQLLDGQTVSLSEDTMIIADETKPLAIAGVMGGLDSGVTSTTQDIFLESAFFHSKSIMRAARRYNLNSESSYRFERGIDPTLQTLAIERATELLLDIVGGQPGPVIDVSSSEHLPQPITLTLRRDRVTRVLGFVIPDADIENILTRLGFSCQKSIHGWQVTVPARRSDIALEVDLIEEIVRLYGCDKLPEAQTVSNMRILASSESKVHVKNIRTLLCDLGYNEVVTYSFIDKKHQALFESEIKPIEILNPITAEMAVMRTSLFPGLVNTLIYNLNRQQSRARLFEVGQRFRLNGDELRQQRVLSGLISGSVYPEQWGITKRDVDFFDLKGDLQSLFKLSFSEEEFTFQQSKHPALHPGQTADIYRGTERVGVMGALHPGIAQKMDVSEKVFLFELLLDYLEVAKLPRLEEISKFPEIRRDLAILVDDSVPAQHIQDTIRELAGELLKDIKIFDVYQGKGVALNHKSIALALTLQHASRTLRDEEVAELMDGIIIALKDRFAAELRG